MRFWKRIVLYSMILFMGIFNSVGIVLIEYLHSNSVKNVISGALFQCDGIVSAIYLNSDKSKDDVRENFEAFIKSYLSFEDQGLSNIEIYSSSNELITSKYEVKYKGIRDETLESSLNEKKFLIRNVNSEKYLFISQSLKIGNKVYKIVLSKNINNIFEERINVYKVFLLLDIITAIVLSLGMYFIARKITKPVETLSKTSVEVSNGNYSKRVEVKHMDEVGVLSNNFNEMLNILENNMKKLNDIGESRQRFIDNLAHESKTPITSILGYSDILLNGNITEDMRIKALSYINTEAKRLEELNSTLLKLTLLKNKSLEIEEINIKEVINDSIKSLNFMLDSKDIRIQASINDCYIVCDKNLLFILITNIIKNAVKASYINSKVLIESIKDVEGYTLKIIDTGIGISHEDLDKIKEPFYIADKSRGGENKGLGLGLSICEEICEMFNIKLSIKSEMNKGTEVSLTFKGEGYEKDFI